MRGNEEGSKPASSHDKLTRRSFLSRAGAVGVATATAAVATPFVAAETNERQESGPTSIPGTIPVSLKVNGEVHKVQIDPRSTVLDTLRETLHLTGTKKGCDHGQCGACTVLIDGVRTNSCLNLAVTLDGSEITTIEGLGQAGNLHPLQAAFVEHDAFQCGYCTPGQICSAQGLINEGHAHTRLEVREQMSGNICRCGAYTNIADAVLEVLGQGEQA